jgi:hypothetical protein
MIKVHLEEKWQQGMGQKACHMRWRPQKRIRNVLGEVNIGRYTTDLFFC